VVSRGKPEELRREAPISVSVHSLWASHEDVLDGMDLPDDRVDLNKGRIGKALCGDAMARRLMVGEQVQFT
jgi:hypothetical protein